MGAAGSAAHAASWETIFAAESAKPTTASDVDDPLTEVTRLRKTLYDGQKAVEAMHREIEGRCSDGKVKLIYQQYQELFPIVNGCISVFEVDDTVNVSTSLFLVSSHALIRQRFAPQRTGKITIQRCRRVFQNSIFHRKHSTSMSV
jgi:hypothetical protein